MDNIYAVLVSKIIVLNALALIILALLTEILATALLQLLLQACQNSITSYEPRHVGLQ